MSLKNQIQYYLEKNGSMTLLELEHLCKSEQKKLSNGERRLREIMSVNPKIKADTNSRGAIIGYFWREPTKPIKEAHKLHSCPSWNAFGVYCPDCRQEIELAVREQATNKLF
jgi:hypothetical protein